VQAAEKKPGLGEKIEEREKREQIRLRIAEAEKTKNWAGEDRRTQRGSKKKKEK